jgi:hypothetical protein
MSLSKKKIAKALNLLQQSFKKSGGSKHDSDSDVSTSGSTSSSSVTGSSSGGGSTTSLIKVTKKKIKRNNRSNKKKKSAGAGGRKPRQMYKLSKNSKSSKKKSEAEHHVDTEPKLSASGMMLYGGATASLLLDRITTLETQISKTQEQMNNMFQYIVKSGGKNKTAGTKKKKTAGLEKCNDIKKGAKRWNQLVACTSKCKGNTAKCRRKCAKEKPHCDPSLGGGKGTLKQMLNQAKKNKKFSVASLTKKSSTATKRNANGVPKYKIPPQLK